MINNLSFNFIRLIILLRLEKNLNTCYQNIIFIINFRKKFKRKKGIIS